MNTHLRNVLGGVAHVDRGRIVWVMPIRAAIVVTVLIAVPVAKGSPAAATPLAIGALFAAVADVGEPVGHRWRTMLWTTLWLMVGTAAGVLVSETIAPLLVVTAVAAALCGFVGAIGSRAAIAGLLTLVVFTVFAGTPESLGGGLRAVLLLGLGGVIQTAVTVLPTLVRHPELARRPDPPAARVVDRLRQHLSTSDGFLRHAVRLAIAVTAGTALMTLDEFPHEYWIPMTIAWVSRPDRAGTATRVASRIGGTIVGVVAVVLLIDGLHLSQAGVVLVCGLGAALALAFIWANYSTAVVGVTILLIALFALDGAPVGETVSYRILDTLIAGVITVAASFIWPMPEPAPPAPPAPPTPPDPAAAHE